jgi:hypothetical protein
MTFITTDPTTKQTVPVPAAILDVFKIDYQGRVTGTSTGSMGGQIMTSSFSGTVQVNPDCTGAVSLTLAVPGMPPISGGSRLWILGNGTEMRNMPNVPFGPLGGAVGIEYARRVSWADPQCTPDMVHGVYAATYEGMFLLPVQGQTQPVAAPYSGIFAMTFGYGGRGTGNATMSMAGTILDFVFTDAAITVNADCTATVNWKGAPKGMAIGNGTDKFVVLNYGDEMISVQTQNTGGAPIIIGKYKRISNVPVAPNW